MKTCYSCKHGYLDMDNNYRCELKKYSESNIVHRTWGKWLVNADKCSDYK